MALDKNGDGKLSKEEMGGQRMAAMFQKADADKDGFVTKAEIEKMFATMQGGRPGGEGGQGGRPGGEGGRPGGEGGPGGRGGPPMPGQILPEFLQEQLSLTAAQKKQLAELQKQVDARLDKMLSGEQKAKLKEMAQRGPGRPGPGGDGPPPKD